MPEYTPRKCTATGRLIGSHDHAAVQFNIGHVNADGLYTNKYTPVALCGYVRENGFADASVNRYALSQSLLRSRTVIPLRRS